VKLALVYDRINKFGGAERVLQTLHKIWPQAPIYTSVYNPKTAPWAENINIISSWLNHLPLARTHHELYPWLTSLAFESFDFSNFDIVISVTSAEAKAVITPPKTLHICYCLTPTRYLWSHSSSYQHQPGLGVFNQLAKPVFKSTKSYLKKIDLINSSRPDVYATISKTSQTRIKRYYRQTSTVIYPPINVSNFSKTIKPQYSFQNQPYYLVVSRLNPYKNISLAVKAANKFKINLVIVGIGRELINLNSLAGPTVKILGAVTDNQLISLYQHAKVLIMPQIEDFGLVSLEAQASGTPVIALNKGGATETIIKNKTGIFFSQATVDSLTSAMKQFNSTTWDKKLIQANAKKFDQHIFINKFKQFVEDKWQTHLKNFQ